MVCAFIMFHLTQDATPQVFIVIKDKLAYNVPMAPWSKEIFANHVLEKDALAAQL